MNRILVCNPLNYSVSYCINPWMDPQIPTDRHRAISQWLDLMEALHECGVETIEMPGEPDLPDMVFTANAATVVGNKAVLSNFAHPERQAEKDRYRRQLCNMGFDVIDLPAGMHYEGAGDALMGHGIATGKTLWCGMGSRSTYEAHRAVRRILKVDTCELKLMDPHFYHLDTCFCPLQDDQALVYCSAFDKRSYDILKWSFYVIDVPGNEARRFACNAVCVGKNVIMPEDCPQTKKALEESGYRVIECPMGEFIKAGGACKCLTLRVNDFTADQRRGIIGG